MVNNRRLVILDDDPTGIQTVKGCKLITVWDKETVRMALDDEVPFFYILTNTRAMTREDAAKVTRQAMETVLEVQGSANSKGLVFISRSDSCLRGHFPLEIDVIRQVLTEHNIKVWDKTPFIPAFIEAGRVTIDGVHYMRNGQTLIPVSETEFARDNVFAYSTSVLRDYIKEKGADPDDYEIVNAQSYEELYSYCNRLLKETQDFDGAIVVRSSSSLPKALSDIIQAKDADTKSDEGHQLASSSFQQSTFNNPGVFIVGSHVNKTTEQLNELLKCPNTKGIETSVEKILDNSEDYLNQTITQLSTHGTPIIYTSRTEIRISDPDKRQQLGQKISDFLVQIVRKLPFTPSYLVAKGGITSHDILTKGLDVRMATVLGQIIPNVPCVMTEKFPYIIFPGNVGDKDSLKELYLKLNNNSQQYEKNN